MSAAAVVGPEIVSEREWYAAHQEHLKKEKLLTRLRDELARERQQLPRLPIKKDYIFAGANGNVSLSELFDGRDELIIYHFMFAPGWEEGCPSCSLIADHVNPSIVHLKQRGVAFAVVSRAPYERIAPFQKRMGWTFSWVSSYGNEFNRDFRVSFTADETAAGCPEYNFGTGKFPVDEAPGFSAFAKDEEGQIFRTFSAFGRGGEPMLGVYNLLDMTARGRHEEGLSFPMAWVRHHDRYPEAEKGHACCGAAKEQR